MYLIAKDENYFTLYRLASGNLHTFFGPDIAGAYSTKCPIRAAEVAKKEGGTVLEYPEFTK